MGGVDLEVVDVSAQNTLDLTLPAQIIQTTVTLCADVPILHLLQHWSFLPVGTIWVHGSFVQETQSPHQLTCSGQHYLHSTTQMSCASALGPEVGVYFV